MKETFYGFVLINQGKEVVSDKVEEAMVEVSASFDHAEEHTFKEAEDSIISQAAPEASEINL